MHKFNKFFIGLLTGSLGVLGYKSYLLFQKDLRLAEQRIKAEGNKIKTPLGDCVCGMQGDGPPVLVIHGAGGGFDQALHTAQMFGENFKWIAPSRFGYLGTPLPEDPSPELQADAYAALLDHWEIDRVPIIGISAGGPSSIQFVMRHPDRCSGLVLVSAISQAMLDVGANMDVMEKIMRTFLTSEWGVWFGMQLAKQKIISPMGVPINIIKELGDQDFMWLQTLISYILPLHSRRDGLINDYLQVLKLDVFPHGKIETPTLIIHARDDSLVSIKHARFSAKLNPKAQFVELSRGGHILLGQQLNVKANVEPFLSQVIH